LHPEEAIKELGFNEQQIKFTSNLEIKNSKIIDNKNLLDDIKVMIEKLVY
jgi:hypothetical protein